MVTIIPYDYINPNIDPLPIMELENYTVSNYFFQVSKVFLKYYNI